MNDIIIRSRIYLVKARKFRGWSQRALAEQLGTTQANVSRWERGVTNPASYFRSKLIALFGKDAYELGLLPENSRETSLDTVPLVLQGQVTPRPLSIALSPIWNIPYQRNPFFAGREDILFRLVNTLNVEKTKEQVQILVISGLGGIGKTQIAIEYTYRFRTNYSAVLWARAETPELLAADFVSIATLLGIPEKTASCQQQIIEGIKNWLSTYKNWLLVIDGVENIEEIKAFLPSAHQGHILLTTCAQATGTLATQIKLETMILEESVLFLLRRAKFIAPDALLEKASSLNCSAAKEICTLLDGLPLALDQAGAYIEETQCELSDYLQLYRAHRMLLLKRRGSSADHPHPVTVTWSFSFERVEHINPAAADLLRLCAFLHPDAIPEEIIIKGATHLGSFLEHAAKNPTILDNAVATLRGYSLVHRNAKDHTLSIHRLVQKVFRDTMPDATQHDWAKRTIRAVSAVFPAEVEFTNWQQCERCLPHALVCVQLIEQRNLVIPDATSLLYRVGQYLRDRAL
jgi:transcriptional regulator with XRE-family HTH domain